MLEDKVTEKVYCYDHPSAYNNHDALAIAAMANKNSGINAAEMMAAMNGGCGANQWMNNPFIYLVFLMMFGRNGLWGNNGNGVQDTEIQGQIQSLRTQMSDNHNSDLLMSAIKGNSDALNTLAANLNCDFWDFAVTLNLAYAKHHDIIRKWTRGRAKLEERLCQLSVKFLTDDLSLHPDGKIWWYMNG